MLVLYGGGSARSTGTLAEVLAALGQRTVFEFGGIEPNPTYETLSRAVDELMLDKRLTPETTEAVTALVGKEGLFDVIATVGFYTTLGFIVNSFATPVDDAIARELSERPLAAP